MWQYPLQRLLQGVITVWFIATATFVAMHSVPGDPLSAQRAMTEGIRANLEARYGLDRPVTEQYFIYMGNLLRRAFGISSTRHNRQHNDITRVPSPVSATLQSLALLFAPLAGLLRYALSDLSRTRLPDSISMFPLFLATAVPSVVFAALGQLRQVSISSL